MVNLDLYRVFYTVAKNGSLTKAAEELYISQPAVSQSVKQLENQLGVTLFNRTHRGMELWKRAENASSARWNARCAFLKKRKTKWAAPWRAAAQNSV